MKAKITASTTNYKSSNSSSRCENMLPTTYSLDRSDVCKDVLGNFSFHSPSLALKREKENTEKVEKMCRVVIGIHVS